MQKSDIILYGCEIMEEKINNVLDKLRPFLINDGGNIEFVKYEDGICYISFMGACRDCAINSITLNEGIKEALVNEIPEIIDVKLV